jgi:FMN-dependent NADH-azoreductase
MSTLLHIDASARGERSHTRRLSRLFVNRWCEIRPKDKVIYRDLGHNPPPPVTESWIAAAFTKPEHRTAEMNMMLKLSDELIDELEQADIIVAGIPMYNFGVPAPMKAYIDNIVRVGRTFGFDRARADQLYWPLLHGKRLVVLSSRGGYGYELGEPVDHMNHVEPHLRTIFGFIGVTELDSIAVEYDEFSDERVERSLAKAGAAVERLVQSLAARSTTEEERLSTCGA